MSSTTTASARRRRILMAVAALVTVLLAAGLATLGTTDRSASGTGSGSTDAGDPRALGRADAPVVMIEYADFQCPYCGKFARDTKPVLIKKYVDQGTLRIEWRDFPLFGEESEAAARAGYAAGLQKKFWEFHDVLYAEPRQRNAGEFSEDNLVSFARQAGVPDLERFRKDMNGDAARRAVERDQQEGYKIGVTSTPAFLVGGQPILGAQPTETFTEAVERAAAQAKAGDPAGE